MEELRTYTPDPVDGVPTIVLDFYGTQVGADYFTKDQYTNPMHYGGRA